MVLNGDTSERTTRSRTFHTGISLLAISAGLIMPQPSRADTTISGTTVGAQVINGSIGKFSITNSGTVTTTLTEAIFNFGTIGTLTNQGVVANTSPLLYGLENGNSIGSINNSGTITGVGGGIVISRPSGTSTIRAAIGAITNSGLISGVTSGAFLNFGGTIGTLTNSGTIKGPNAIINATDGTILGVLGTVVNSGLIAGDILNDANVLTIKGGTGSTIGTLTGYVTGSKGTITSAADIVFASGDVLLNDGIFASGHTVSNSGAAVTLTTVIGITGSFAQTAGKLVLGINGALTVSGGANLSGGTVLETLPTVGNYFAGTLATLVQSNAASSYGGATVSTNLPALLSTGSTVVGNRLMLLAFNDYVGGTLATLNNTGTINSSGAGIAVAATGDIGTLSNSGTVFGATRGVYLYFGAHIGTISNSGLIAAGTLGGVAAGGIANSAAIDAIVNDGTILSSRSSGIGNNYSVASIGRLINNGLLSGATGGIYTEGTINTLVNTGRIIGAQAGINVNGGKIGTIDNSGTVAGPLALTIASGSTIGGIGNRGLISGNILNGSANTLTITGGTAGTVGTLTGQSGKGTITNTAGNLVFASGDLLLNDNIVATGRTVSNTGAGLVLDTLINLTGNYSQTSGILRIDPTTGGLIASGTAVFSGGTVITDFASTGNYLRGSHTLLSGSTLNLSGATVLTGAITGLDRSSNTGGNKLLLVTLNDYVGGTLATLTNSAAITGSDTGLYVATTGSIGTLTNNGTFGGALYGVNSFGTIATLSNNGLITAANPLTALANQGSIGQLSNSGTITNGGWALLNNGTIGTITNTGVMSGGSNAIQNFGVLTLLSNSGTLSGGSNAIAGILGTIANSGVIRGDINKDGGVVDAIIGGSNGTVGTFTGYTGSTPGTFGASSNLTFASGAVWLNDTILARNVAASELTVSNAGADIAVSTIVTIDANYRQTAGVLNLGSNGKLVVTQAATFSGGTIAVGLGGVPATATYRVGDTVGDVIVAGGAGSSYGGVRVASTGGITGLSAAAKAIGTNLAVAAGNIYIGDTQVSVGNTGTIIGVDYPVYVASTGTVGTLANTGTLTGLADGLNTNGRVGTLSNSGLISGAQKGVGNQGTIGTLINVVGGTILGGTAAGLQNDTSLGTLTNAGYISSGSAGFANYGTMGVLANTGTITGGPQGIYNAGSIATIANSGSILSGQSALGLGGVVTVLTNSGLIGNGSNAISVSDTLGTLINQAGATISGNNALSLQGTLGGLANSGIIRGAIRNDTANVLTIAGGAAGTIGTLTGQSGSGTIINTLSNLLFASGNLLLNDHIVATGRTVGNLGANLQLNTIINLTGNYSQTGGTLVVDPLLAGLVVSGAVVISGGTVQSDLSSTGNYLSGSHTLVSGSALNLAGATIAVSTVTGLHSSTQTVGNKLLLSIANDYVGGTLATLVNASALTAASTGLYVATTGSIGTVTNSGTLGGAQFGVNNLGTIATLSNTGLITNANFTALWNQGSIGRLLNSGTITNGSWAILNSGTIGTLTNTGVVAGSGVAIKNNGVVTLFDNSGTVSSSGDAVAGTFGTIVNAGVIRGNINPNGGMVGTIVGGSGGTVGTFTGTSGSSLGTIGANGNLTFASGAVLLNDSILAVGIAPSALTVSNVGADIGLATIVTIGANYHQTAGVLNLGSSGGLVVTEAAILSGGTISANLGGLSAVGTYRAGSAAGGTLVAGGTGSSYTGVDLDVPGSITGLKLSAITSGTNLIVAADNDYIGDTQGTLANEATITGATYALYVAGSGTIGSLTNNGVLDGVAAGLSNGGRIGTLVNWGWTGGPVGIHNLTTIDALGNAGTVFGAGGATASGVLNAGTIGLLVNIGLIGAGTATNASYGIDNVGWIGTIVNGAGGTVSNDAGNGAGISNAGTIGFVSNAGLVTGSGSGFSNGGTIDRFANSGTIRTNDDQRMTGLYNSGTIGTLTNSGVIGNHVGIANAGGTIGFLINAPGGTIGGVVGISDTGTIGMLSSSGTITGTSEGLYVSGRIGTVLNAGVLTASAGPAITITNAGMIGGIANSGQIRGDIVNAGANDLTITGGFDTLVGTLTGSVGRGLIENTGSNLSFSSGALMLNDDIVVGAGHDVTNQGANLTLGGMLTITGNYRQTGGVLSLVPGTTGLTVSGTAVLSGGTVSGNLSSGGNYLAGDSIVLVAGGTGSNYAGVTVNGAPTGLLATKGIVGSALIETFGNTYIGGTLSALTNTGELSAQTAIYVASSGNLGTLANSGTVRGDIVNTSANALTIAGGMNGAVGTFTGQSGQGRIVSTIGNVELASGSMLLDDAVDVGTGTLVNTGAAVAVMHGVSVTGAFAQTGGTLSFATGTGTVIASGAAALSGGTIELTGFSTTGNYLVGGSSGTVVQGGLGSTFTNLSYASDVTGLQLAGSTQGNALQIDVANYYVGGSLGSIVNGRTLAVPTSVYVAASGTLGTLTNDGSLIGQMGVVNRGMVGAVINAGTLDVGTTGIVNIGTIGLISNDGLLAGPVAIDNAGALGSIANSGTLAGNIIIRSVQDLVFAGGDGGFGTLTGYVSGSQGTITNTLGNVVLASGGIVLNDTVVLGTGTLVNDGASVRLDHSVNVVGNYAQGSGTLALGMASLLVSGVATIDGGLITSNQLDGTANYIAGSGGGTLVRAGAGSRYDGVSVASGITGLAIASATGTIGGNVDLLLAIDNDYVGGTLGHLVNSGTITGVSTAAYVAASGSLGTVGNSGTLQGIRFGVRNIGLVDRIENDGVIGGAVGLYNGGTIGTILNAGSIIDTPVIQAAGLHNDGVIDAVLNTGLISGTARGLYNNATIGRIINSGTIAGLLAFYNGGSIGTVDNSGLITDSAGPVSAGLNNSGQLDVLRNSGTISGATYGLVNSGSIGRVTNLGLITGATAVYSAAGGTLGPIDNAGFIAGNIDNRSAQALSIIGGTFDASGTLTGFNGARGTISSTAADVVFGPGVQLLDDDIIATGHVVSNVGATLGILTSASITGGYSQTAGALYVLNGARLVVSGAASLTGGAVVTEFDPEANYRANESAGTLIRGGAGSGYAGVTVDTGNIAGLALSTGVTGTDLVVTARNTYVGASLGSVANTGSLAADYPVYVAATGNLGSLANSGTLSGALAAIYNAGTLGPIVNSGVIAGDITNRSAQALSISGGTLTGYAPGSQGTIFSGNGNVELTGDIALNDAFDVGTNTVINAGASLSLSHGVSIAGNFSQNSGSLALGLTPGLVVSGAARFTGGTVSTSIATAATHLAGAAVTTLVQGGAGSRYTGIHVDTGDTPGLALTAGASGSNLVVTAGNDYIGSTLASLSNSGSLAADYPVYVARTGSLGALVNTGTLGGTIAAIYNAGTLGPIANSGVIAGDIENWAAQTLTLSGGTGTDFGTLTGFGGVRGTILSPGGDVAFIDGALALNDDVVAKGHVVSNGGATLRLATSANVTGGYSQTSGTLVLAQDAKLVVSDAATLSGGTISATFSPTANYLVGATAGTLVQAGAGSRYSGVTVSTGSTPGLALASATSGSNLIVTAENNFVGATLGSLSNNGSLSARYPVYIAATGTLGSLTNSGTLSGSDAAIRNLGVIGPIANTGMIAGNIVSDASAALAITGGSGTVFGTLTGYAADSQGTIINTGGNLLLTGNIALNDAVDVGSRTVVADGATLAVNAAVGITGNYSQTGGTLLIGVTSTAAYGQLAVGGSASLTGTNVTLVKLGSATLAAGQAYTVVKAGGALTFSNLTSSITGLNGAFASVASGGVTGLVLSLSEPAGTITPPPPPPPTNFTGTGIKAGGPGVGTGAALDAIADLGGSAASPVITDVLLPLSQLSAVQQQAAIIQLSPTQLTPQVIAVAVSPAVNAIVQHQDVLAAAVTGREERGLAAGSQGQRGAIWGQFLINSATRAAVAAAPPYNASSYGVMIGADLVGTSNLIAGGAISWVNSTAHGRGNINGSSTTLNSFQATGYFTWQPGDPETSGLSIDGQLGFGYNTYHQRRRIDFLGVSARASYDGQQYLGNLRASYTIPLSISASVTPFASIREVHLHNAGYQERDAASANLTVSKLDVDSLSQEVGVQGAGIFEAASGRLAPVVKLGWVHTYTNGPIPISAVLGGVAFTSTAARGARDGLTVGAGLSFMQTERFRIGVQYDGDLRRDFKSHSGTVKLTFNL